jgi:hypothetical protein
MFEITITEKTTVKKIGGREWKVVDKRPYTKEEYNNERYFLGSGNKEVTTPMPIKEVMGYTPEKEVEETVERQILKQSVESVDLQKVIKAINNIE